MLQETLFVGLHLLLLFHSFQISRVALYCLHDVQSEYLFSNTLMCVFSNVSKASWTLNHPLVLSEASERYVNTQ